VPRSQADAFRARHQVISARLAAGASVLHVYSEGNPGDGFEQVEPDLEDVYFHRLAMDTSAAVPVDV
jgi:hypothetical protein